LSDRLAPFERRQRFPQQIDCAVSRTAPALASAQQSLARIVRSACSPTRLRLGTRTGARRRVLHLHLGTPFLRARRRSLRVHAVAARCHGRGLRQACALNLKAPRREEQHVSRIQQLINTLDAEYAEVQGARSPRFGREPAKLTPAAPVSSRAGRRTPRAAK
jgi:hypothetical protein